MRLRFLRGEQPICWVAGRRKAGLTGSSHDQFLRRWLSSQGIRRRLARRGIESSQRLGKHRWVVERTVSWLSGCRRLHRRYERKPQHFPAFTAIAATLIRHRRLTN